MVSLLFILSQETEVKIINDPLIGISPIDCYSCKSKYPDYSYCNNNNTYGACCPEFSKDDSCLSNVANKITCSEDDPNHDFFYSNCMVYST